jgi:hypothetical protein
MYLHTQYAYQIPSHNAVIMKLAAAQSAARQVYIAEVGTRRKPA